MEDAVARVAAVVLAATFGWAAVAKVLRFRRWRDALRRYALPPRLEAVARLGTPAAEAAVAGAVVAGAVRPAAAASLALLGGFSFVLFSARRTHGRRLPCGCFGGASARDYRLMLLRNSVLALCAAAVVAGPEDLDPTASAAAPPAPDLLPTVLVGLGIVTALFVVWQVDAAVRRGRRR